MRYRAELLQRSLHIPLLLAGSLAFSACSTVDGPSSLSSSKEGLFYEGESEFAMSDAEEGAGKSEKGFWFSIAASEDWDEATQSMRRPQGKALSKEEENALLAQLALEKEDEAKEAFFLREGPPAPKEAGEKLEHPFAPVEKTAPKSPDDTELEPGVLRFQPEGEVPIAPRVSITFKTPMVALSTLPDTSNEVLPVKLQPEISGEWRWLGTETLIFEPRGALPMATRYEVQLKEGVKDASGKPLGDTFSFSFQTPPPRLVSSGPSGEGVGLQPTFYFVFDQKVSEEALLQVASLEVDGKNWGFRPLTAAEKKKDKQLLAFQKNANIEGRWLVLKGGSELPKDKKIQVKIGEGLASLEGERVTKEAYGFAFRTYAPLKVMEADCWDYDSRDKGLCRPSSPYYIRFNNALEKGSFPASFLTVEPSVKGLGVQKHGDGLLVTGDFLAHEHYRFQLSEDITDIYSQKLGKSEPIHMETGASRPYFSANWDAITVLDPYAKEFSLEASVINHPQLELKVYAPEISDWGPGGLDAKLEKKLEEEGKLLFSGLMDSGVEPELRGKVRIPLGSYLKDGRGQLLVSLSTVSKEKYRPKELTWVMATQIGLDVFSDSDELYVWASDLKNGRPLENVSLSLGKQEALSDASGLARFDLGDKAEDARMIVAKLGNDVTFLPESKYGYGSGWHKVALSESLSAFIVDDRQLYRPGETVSLKGVIRERSPSTRGGLSYPKTSKGRELTWQLKDARGLEIGKGSIKLNDRGSFSLETTLPETPNLGHAYFQFRNEDAKWPIFSHAIDIQEFRRPEFEVSLAQSEGPYFVGEEAELRAAAKYFSGGALPFSELRWRVDSKEASFSPPKQEKYIFGEHRPWWRIPSPGGGWKGMSLSKASQTDALGQAGLALSFERVNPPRATTVTASATVQDVNRQSFTKSQNFLVHPSSLYLGLRADTWFVAAGEDFKVGLIASDLDGKLVPNVAIELRAEELTWEEGEDGIWGQKVASYKTCKTTSQEEEVSCHFSLSEGGQYRIVGRLKDDEGRVNESSFVAWVWGDMKDDKKQLEKEELSLIPNQESYEVGDELELMIVSPFQEGEGMLVLNRGDIDRVLPFQVREGKAFLRVTIESWMVPGFDLHASVNGLSVRAGSKVMRPAHASANVQIEVPPLSRQLAVEVEPEDKELSPGGKTSLALTVKDPDGQPVADAEVLVFVVDEAVLALHGKEAQDPLKHFYKRIYSRLASRSLRDNLVLSEIAELEAMGSGGGDGAGLYRVEMAMPKNMASGDMMLGAPSPVMRMAGGVSLDAQEEGGSFVPRSDFNPLALFAPDERTSKDGQLNVDVSLPDNLTRYRILAYAFSGAELYGKGENTLTARLPLMLKMNAPRFLNFGDSFMLSLVLENQSDVPLESQVAVRGQNAVFTDGAGRSVLVPARDRVEVLIPVKTDAAGKMKLSAIVKSGAYVDASELSLPVYTPATSESMAAYGVLDEGSSFQAIERPEEVWPQFGGLSLSVSSTQLSALTDAFLYLVNYPFEGSTHLASKILSVTALKDVLSAFQAEGLPSEKELLGLMEDSLTKLYRHQNFDGGFGFWRADGESSPYVSLHVAHALVRYKAEGGKVDAGKLEKALSFAAGIEGFLAAKNYPLEIVQALRAYGLYVEHLSGKRLLLPAAKDVLEASGGLSKVNLEVLGWLYPVFIEEGNKQELQDIQRLLENRVSEMADKAHFVTRYDNGQELLLHSDRRVDALLLEGLMKASPNSSLIPKIVKGLLAHRTAGRWSSTQESSWVLLALNAYFRAYEKDVPNFKAKAWLGNHFLGDMAFKGRSTESQSVFVPMSWLKEQGEKENFVLNKTGKGRLYYRLGMDVAPRSLELSALQHGFYVERRYEAVDHPDDVKQVKDGRWQIKAGARVKVQLSLYTKDRRYHVALVDAIPAGFELVNAGLLGNEALPDGGGSGSQPMPISWRNFFSWYHWYNHENMRDERIEVFANSLPAGVYSYTYTAKATQIGNFVVPPLKAEELFSPETFGRSQSEFVEIVEE